MFALMDPRVIGAIVLSLIVSFAAGYLTKAHYAAIEVAEAAAKQKTIVETVEKVVTVSDTRRAQVLAAKLKASEARVSALQRMIAEESNEKPVPVECRISDSLRQSINGELSAAAQ